MKIVIDTNIWKLKDTIEKVRNEDGRLLVPTIVLAEVLDIAEKHRVEFNFNKLYRLIRENPEFEIVGFDSEIFDETIRLKEIKECCNCKVLGAGILTKDRIITESGEL